MRPPAKGVDRGLGTAIMPRPKFGAFVYISIAEISESGPQIAIPSQDAQWRLVVADIAEGSRGSKVDAKVDFARHGNQLEVRGHLHGQVGQCCSRCAEDTDVAIDCSFVANYLVDERVDPEKELQSYDLESSALVGEGIELFEVLREQILLALPNQPYCKDDCAGLCVVCGTNRNLEECSCSGVHPDSPFAALAGLVSPGVEE